MSAALPFAAPAENVSARDRLLDAATELFSASGYDVTSVRVIVDRAGTNLNAINYYFGGKRGLYEAVMARETTRARTFTGGLPRATAGDPIELRLESVVLRLLTFFVSPHSRLPRLAALEVVNPSLDFAASGPAIHDAERFELRAIVADVLGADAGDEVLDQAVRAVLSQCVYFMFMNDALRRAGSPVFASAAAVRTLAAQITAFSIGGLRALATARA